MNHLSLAPPLEEAIPANPTPLEKARPRLLEEQGERRRFEKREHESAHEMVQRLIPGFELKRLLW